MCFSVYASFGAGVILGVVGAVVVKKTKDPTEKLFGAIPLLFSVQQISEGFVWLSFRNVDYAASQQGFVHIFLFFAFVLWPVWIPLSILLLEEDVKRRRILRLLTGTGFFISLYIVYCMFAYPLYASIEDHHIHYSFGSPQELLSLRWLSDAFYFIVTIPPAFISSKKRVWIFGVIIAGSYIISRILFKDVVVSVWCFLAGILSIAIYFILSQKKTSTTTV